MKLPIILAMLVAFAIAVQAQEGLLSALAEQMPNCSLACFIKEIPQSTCANNLTPACMCTNAALNAAVGACAMQTCTTYEMLQTKNASGSACGVPVRENSQKFIIIGISGIVIAVLAFFFRIAASLPKLGRPLSWDDATMAVVVLLAIPPAVFAPFLVKNGLGRDMWTLKAEQITNVLYFYFLGEVFYVLALGISKVSILYFYLRVFPEKKFRHIIYGVMGLSVAYTIAFFFATTFQCTPISYAWTQWDGLHHGRCNDIHLQGWIAAAINIALDTVVMVLPLKHLARLNMNIRKKLMVMAMFSVGIIVVFTSAMRLYSLAHFANSKNITWDYVEAGYWSLIEINVSIICGCMPALRLLISKMWPTIKMTFHSNNGNSTYSSGFTGTSKSSATGKNKSLNISTKPQTVDDGDFVPLVNVDTRSVNASATNEPEHGLSNWRTQNPVERFDDTKNPTIELSTSNQSGSWPMGEATTGKEHV